MKKLLLSLAAVLCCAMAGSAVAAPDTVAYKAERAKIATTAKADRKACDALKANAKDICMAEAKGKEKVAKAELDANNKPSAAAAARAKIARAEADYKVAKEKCDDMTGNDKDKCMKDAKAARSAAKADAKATRAKS